MADIIKVVCSRDELVAIADAVRNKTGMSAEMTLQAIARNILSISGGGGVILPTLSNEGTAADLMNGKELINEEGQVIIGEFTLDEELSTQESLIEEIKSALARVVVPEGKIPVIEELIVAANGTYTAPNGVDGYSPVIVNVAEPLLEDRVVTPEAEDQVIFANPGYDGLNSVTVNGDSNLIPENIKLGVTIFGVEGTAAGGGDIEPDYRDLYQRVEYITSAEEETYPYIFTDVCATNTIGVEVIASFPILQDRVPMGSRQDSGTTRFYCVYPMSTSSVYYGFNTGSSVSCALKTNTIYRLQTNFLNSRLVCVYESNGTRKANVSLSATLTPHTVPITIFGYNSASGGQVTSKREYLLYHARISDGYEVIRDYIPCYRKSDGEVGLYEKITGQFLTNDAATGAFTAGADIDW